MVLQRWQTVYLLVAVAAMIIFLINPVMEINIGQIAMKVDAFHVYPEKAAADVPAGLSIVWVAILGWVAVALGAGSVVTYRKLKLQKTLALVCSLISFLIAFSVVYIGLFLYDDGYPVWRWTAFLPFATGVMALMAFFAIGRDKKLIESADRLWD